MAVFGWIGGSPEPPERWDLRNCGWTLCHGQHGSRMDCRHVLVIDTHRLDQTQRMGLAQADRPAWRLIMLGVELGAERASLLGLGCAEALSETTTLHELDARARRVAEMFGTLPRWRDIGPVVLDLFHRDGRRGNRWLGLHPREFGLLWRLADTPGQRVTRADLLRDVWRIRHDPETNSVEVHISRLRAKLALAGCPSLIETLPEGGYLLAREEGFMLAPPHRPPSSAAPDNFTQGNAAQGHQDALDRYLRGIEWARYMANEIN